MYDNVGGFSQTGNEVIISAIEQYYPFAKKQCSVWESIREKVRQADSLCEQNVTELDKYISRLGDAHTCIQSISPRTAVFCADVFWNGSELYWRDGSETRRLETINQITIEEHLSRYRKEYGLKENLVKRKMIQDIKVGNDFFVGDILEFGFVAEGKSVSCLLKKTGVAEIKQGLSEEVLQMIAKIKTVYIKRLDEETVYIKLSTFREKDIVQKFLEELQAEVGTEETVRNIIFDIRDNLGGYVDSAMKLASLVIAENMFLDYEVADAAGSRQRYEIKGNQQRLFRNRQVILFVNHQTQSCAEYVFARSLALSGQPVLVVGERTAGVSGQARELLLDQRFLLSVTTKRYFKQGTDEEIEYGVIPTIELKTDEITSAMSQQKDAYLEWYMANKKDKGGQLWKKYWK